MALKLFWVAPATALALPISFVSIQPLWNNELRLATYQSYISDEIASEAYQKYGIKTSYFENDKEVLGGFRSGSYDFAIVSSSTLEEAISQNLVKKIDWTKLSSIPQRYKSESSGGSPFTDELFAPIINYIFSKKAQLYEYGIPYFLSYLTFVYTGEKLNHSESLNWDKLLEAISKDSRFSSHNRESSPKLAFIEDELTIFYISKLISKSAHEESEIGQDNQLDFYDQLSKLTAKDKLGNLGSQSIFLHPNSALVSEMMSSGSLNGAFMYNGDALYTYKTMKEESKLIDPDKQIHIFEGSPSLWLLDSIAISSKLSAEREEKVYQFLNQLLFQGIMEEKDLDLKVDKSSWAWKNFDYLKYTPTLNSFQKKLRGEKNENKSIQSPLQLDEREKEILFGKQDLDKCKWSENKADLIDQHKDCQVIFEGSLSDSQNLQLALAFQRWKSNL